MKRPSFFSIYKTDFKIDLIPDENEEEEQCNAPETKKGKYKWMRMSLAFLCIIVIIYSLDIKMPQKSKPSSISCVWNIKQHLYALNSI